MREVLYETTLDLVLEHQRAAGSMADVDDTDQLDLLWQSIPKLLEQDEGWALRAVLASGVAGYTREEDTPEGLMVRHNPDGTRQLVRINIDGPDTIIRTW